MLKRKLYAAVVIVVIVLMAFAVPGCSLLKSVGSKSAGGDIIIYYKDEAVYAAIGKTITELDDAMVFNDDAIRVNAIVNRGMNYIYYLADTKNGEGDLMRISIDNPGKKPEECATDVCCARVSSDGESVLFLRDINDGSGELFLWKDGREESIEDDVLEGGFGLSPNGDVIFFCTADGSEQMNNQAWVKGERKLYVKNKKSDPEKVDSFDSSEAFRNIYLFDDGTLIYTVMSNSEGKVDIGTYIYSRGDENKLDDGYSIAVFSSSEMLLLEDKSLYFRSKDGETERITKNFRDYAVQDASLLISTSIIHDTSQNQPEHIVLFENDDGELIVSEWEAGKELNEIISTDLNAINYYYFSEIIKINDNFDWMAYVESNELKLAKKSGSEWEDDIDVLDEVSQWYRDFEFDASERYLLYLDNDNELRQYKLSNEEDERLMKDVDAFYLWDSSVMAATLDDELYIITNGEDDKIADDVLWSVESTDGGLYVLTGEDAYDLIYFSSGSLKDERIEKDIERIAYFYSAGDYIEYVPDYDGNAQNEDTNVESAATEAPEATAAPAAEEEAAQTPEPVQIIFDEVLEQGIKDTLEMMGESVGKNITISDMEKLTYLKIVPMTAPDGLKQAEGVIIVDFPIYDLSGLEYAVNLTELFLPYHLIYDISMLESMYNLETIELSNNQISDISALKNLHNVNILYLYGNYITDISPLSGHTELKYLAIGDTVSDISVIYEFTNLVFLGLKGDQITDISGIAGLTNLEFLSITDTGISDISVVANFPLLGGLMMKNTKVEDISVLEQLDRLYFLSIDQEVYDMNQETVAILEANDCTVYK